MNESEPGTVPDTSLGLPGEAEPFSEEDEELGYPTEINDEEPEED